MMISFEERIEKSKWQVFASFSVLFVALRAADSYFRPFWFDELFTWNIARIPTISGLWAALGPMDPSPPLYFIITRLFQTVCGYGEFATRLPALMSFLVALLFLFLLLDRRCGAVTALTGVLLLCFTPAAVLVTNARTYSSILALCLISFWCWQASIDNPRRVLPLCGLFLSLCMCLYLHFYAFLLFLPLAAGELYRSVTLKRIDWPLWLTLALAASTIVPLLPLARRCASLSPSFWSKPTLPNLLRCCYLYASQALMALITFSVSIALKYLRPRKDHPQPEIAPTRPTPGHELIAAIVLALIPVPGLLLALTYTNAFVPRYFASATIGAIIALAYCRDLIRPPAPVEKAILLVAASALFISLQGYLITSAIAINRSLESRISIMLNTGDELSIVVLSPLSYLQTQHYAPDSLKRRLVYLTDPELRTPAAGRSPDISLTALATFKPIKVDSLRSFLTTHDQFYVAGGNALCRFSAHDIVSPGDLVIGGGHGRPKYLSRVYLP